MLYSEFAQRTGFYPTDDQFDNEIHPDYMKSDLSKDEFCAKWKKNHGKEFSKRNRDKIWSLQERNKKLTQLIKNLTSHTDLPVDFDYLYKKLIEINGEY